MSTVYGSRGWLYYQTTITDKDTGEKIRICPINTGYEDIPKNKTPNKLKTIKYLMDKEYHSKEPVKKSHIQYTVHEAVEIFIAYKKLKLKNKHSIKDYNHLRQFQRFYSDTLLIELNEIKILEYRNSINLKLNTIRNRMKKVREFLGYCRKQEWIDLDEKQDVDVPKYKVKVKANVPNDILYEPILYFQNQVNQLQKELVITKTPVKIKSQLQTALKYYRMTYFMYHTGCRPIELVRLRYEHFYFSDIDNKVILIEKGMGEREFPLTKELKTVFAYAKGKKGSLCETSSTDDTNGLNYFKTILRKFNIKMTDYRRGFASRWEKKISAYALADLMGHTNLKTGKRHYVTSDKKEALQVLNGEKNSVEFTDPAIQLLVEHKTQIMALLDAVNNSDWELSGLLAGRITKNNACKNACKLASVNSVKQRSGDERHKLEVLKSAK